MSEIQRTRLGTQLDIQRKIRLGIHQGIRLRKPLGIQQGTRLQKKHVLMAGWSHPVVN